MSDGMKASRDAGDGRGSPRLARDYEHDETDGERADVGHRLHSAIISPDGILHKVLRRLTTLGIAVD
jgi:hypothetical protein